MSLARIAEMQGDNENMLFSFEKALSHNRLNITALYSIGCCYEKSENYSKAADCFRSLVTLNDQNGNTDAWGHLGYCYMMLNDLSNAHTAYQYAMYNNTASQRDPKLWFGIGQLYERSGSLDHAEESFEVYDEEEYVYEYVVAILSTRETRATSR
jgi:glucose repression mediator protein